MRVGLFLSFFFFYFGVGAQTKMPTDTSHYFSIYCSSYLKGESDEIFPDHVEPSPDGLSYIAYISKADNKRIWTSPDGINWGEPHVSFDKSFYEHLIKDAPGSFSISDLKFNPQITAVNRASWNREPLLSFYLWSEMHFISASTCYMHTDGKLYQSTDGGNHWNRLLDSGKYVSKIFYGKKDANAVLNTHEFVKIDASGNIQKIGRFKSGKHSAQIMSMQFQGDTIAYFLVTSGNKDATLSFYKSINDLIIKKPLLRSLPVETEMLAGCNSIILWSGKNSLMKSDDGGESWIQFKNSNATYSDLPYIGLRGMYLVRDSIVMGFGFSSEPHNILFSTGKLLFDKHIDTAEGARYKNRFQEFTEKDKIKHDSDNYCKCRDYASTIQNHRQIENGTYIQTQLTYLFDKAPDITLKDGKFWYNPRAFNKEPTTQNESMPETKGDYVASESTITFTTEEKNNYFNSTYFYMFDGNNLSIYKCDLENGQTNLIQFHNFGKENVYNPPVSIAESASEHISHASDYLYSFTSDSNKFIITLTDMSGRLINDASIKFDDIYATPIFDGQYYFDKRTLMEYIPLTSKPTLIIISHPDYDPLLIGYPTAVKKYVLQKKKKK